MIRRPPRSTLFPSRRSSDLPARATFVEGLDFPRPNRASDPVVGGDHENQPVDIEGGRSEEHTSELQSQSNLVCRLLLEKKKNMTGYFALRRPGDIMTSRPFI